MWNVMAPSWDSTLGLYRVAVVIAYGSISEVEERRKRSLSQCSFDPDIGRYKPAQGSSKAVADDFMYSSWNRED